MPAVLHPEYAAPLHAGKIDADGGGRRFGVPRAVHEQHGARDAFRIAAQILVDDFL